MTHFELFSEGLVRSQQCVSVLDSKLAKWASWRCPPGNRVFGPLWCKETGKRWEPGVCGCLVTQWCLILCNSMDCSPPGSLCPWDFPGNKMGLGGHFLLQGIFLTQGSKSCLLHGRANSLHWASGIARLSSVQFSSVAQSCPTLQPHESQHARPPCPSPTPGVHSDSRPSSQWCHPAVSTSVWILGLTLGCFGNCLTSRGVVFSSLKPCENSGIYIIGCEMKLFCKR